MNIEHCTVYSVHCKLYTIITLANVFLQLQLPLSLMNSQHFPVKHVFDPQ